MGGTSVTFNVSATLLLCLIRGGFLRFFHGTLVAYMFLLDGVVRLWGRNFLKSCVAWHSPFVTLVGYICYPMLIAQKQQMLPNVVFSFLSDMLCRLMAHALLFIILREGRGMP